MAVRLCQPLEGCLFHLDRAIQYCAYDYQKKLQAYGLRKRGLETAVQAACANRSAMAGCQFQGISSSQRAAGQSLAILAMTSAI
jgi:hypothetical protein